MRCAKCHAVIKDSPQSLTASFMSIDDEAPKNSAPMRMLELTERLRLNLTDAFTGHRELLTDFSKRMRRKFASTISFLAWLASRSPFCTMRAIRRISPIWRPVSLASALISDRMPLMCFVS
jgi:hypothetical protein